MAVQVTVREKPPTALAVRLHAPSGTRGRWAADERKPENVPNGITLSSIVPGGNESFDCVLNRKSNVRYSDMEELTEVRVEGVGGACPWLGRLEKTPRSSGVGESTVNPQAVGYQALLEDNPNVKEIVRDIDMTQWSGPSTQRKLNLTGTPIDQQDAGSVTHDESTGAPSMVSELQGPWSRSIVADSWYDADGVPLTSLGYGWKINTAIVGPFPGNWVWTARLSDDDVNTSSDTTGNLAAAGPVT